MINFAINGDLPSLFKTLETLRVSGLDPNSRTYHIIIRACVDNGDVFHAVQLLLDAKENRISLERGTYNVCMNGIIKELREVSAERDREEKGRCLEQVKRLMDDAFIEPNGSTLALMVEGYMLLADTGRAMETLAELISLLHGGVSDDLAEAVVSYCERADAAEVRTFGQRVLDAAERNDVALPASMRTALA
jgi:pentatricopeptide repeat protein